MMTRFKLTAFTSLSLIAGLMLSACDVQMKLPTLPSSSASPSPSTSASPSSTPSASPSSTTDPVASPTPVASASAAVGGELKINGADLFNKFNVNYRVGMKWVYGIRLADLAIPGLPAGINIPGFPGSTGSTGSSGSSSLSNLGEVSWEVISMDNNTVTIKTVTTTNTPAGTQSNQNTVSFEKNSQASLYSQAQAPGTNGTVTWTLGASGESVTVPAGTFTADRIEGNFDVVSQTGGATGNLKSQVKTWINSTAGMVKQETKSDLAASGAGAAGQTSTTTIIELKSFTP